MVFDPAWEELGRHIPKEKLIRLYELTAGEYSSIDGQSFKNLRLTSKEKAAWSRTTLFDDFIRSRLVDFFIGIQIPDKTQLVAAKLLTDWRKAETAIPRDEAIEVS